MTKKEKWNKIRNICFLDLSKTYTDLTDRQIADKSGISRATFNRMRNDKHHIPTPENVVKLLRGSNNRSLLWDAIELVDGEFKKLADEMEKEKDTMENKILESYELKVLFNNPLIFIAYELASLKKGASEDRLIRVLGVKGLKAMEKLIKKELVYKRKGRFYAVEYGVLMRDEEALKNQLQAYLKHYEPNSFQKEVGNFIAGFSDGLTKEALQLVEEEFCRHYNNLKEIYRNPDNVGSFPSFSGIFCDVLDREHG